MGKPNADKLMLSKADLVKSVGWRRDIWQQQLKDSRAEFAEQTRKDIACEIGGRHHK